MTRSIPEIRLKWHIVKSIVYYVYANDMRHLEGGDAWNMRVLGGHRVIPLWSILR